MCENDPRYFGGYTQKHTPVGKVHSGEFVFSLPYTYPAWFNRIKKYLPAGLRGWIGRKVRTPKLSREEEQKLVDDWLAVFKKEVSPMIPLSAEAIEDFGKAMNSMVESLKKEENND